MYYVAQYTLGDTLCVYSKELTEVTWCMGGVGGTHAGQEKNENKKGAGGVGGAGRRDMP